jgi:hypothetical protein
MNLIHYNFTHFTHLCILADFYWKLLMVRNLLLWFKAPCNPVQFLLAAHEGQAAGEGVAHQQPIERNGLCQTILLFTIYVQTVFKLKGQQLKHTQDV